MIAPEVPELIEVITPSVPELIEVPTEVPTVEVIESVVAEVVEQLAENKVAVDNDFSFNFGESPVFEKIAEGQESI